MKNTIRPMTIADIDIIYAIESRAHITPWNWTILRDCVLVGYDCRVLERTQKNKVEAIGYIISRQVEGIYHILNLCIDLPSQSQGHGRYLLETVLASLATLPLHSVILEVRKSNQVALQLYQSLGFQQIGTKEAYYIDADGVEDGIILEKNLI